MDNMVYSYRRYAPGDEYRLYELFDFVWGQRQILPRKDYWVRGWRWMFINNPAGGSIIWLAEHNCKLIGEYPLIMINMKVGEKLIKAGQIADTMTDPHFRRRGIAFLLGKESLKEMKGRNALIAFGFPTKEAYPLHMKSGWLDVCDIKIMVKPINFKNLLEEYFKDSYHLKNIFSIIMKLLLKSKFITRKPPLIDGLTIEEVYRFDSRVNDLWEWISKDYNIIVARDETYLNWRYIDSPNANYRVCIAEKHKKIHGYIVLDYTRYNGLLVGRILDIVAPLDQQDIVQCLISNAEKYFEKNGVDAILSSIVCNRYYNIFLRNGFIPYLKSKNRFIAYNASSDISDGYLMNPKNWFIQLGDLPMIF